MNSIEDKTSNLVFKNSNFITFHPNSETKAYGVEMIIEVSEKERTAINYKVSVCWEFVNKDGEYLVLVKFKDFLINQSKPELLMEILAERCRQPINEIKFLLTSEGKIASILNHEAIVQKWHEVKEDLRKEFSGRIFEKYVALQENSISDESLLLEKLKKDIFLSQFFSGIYQHNFKNFSFETIENTDFINIPYEIPVQVEMLNQGVYSKRKELFLRKFLSEKAYNFNQMPIKKYKTFYTLDADHYITNVMGKFEALNQSLSFTFNLKEQTII